MTSMDAEPDWDSLACETVFSRGQWIAAGMYLGDMPDWLDLWPHVERLVKDSGCTPLWAASALRRAASALRKAFVEPPVPLGRLADTQGDRTSRRFALP